MTVTVTSGTAKSGTDFTAEPASFALTIPENAATGTATFILIPVFDTFDLAGEGEREGDETVRVDGEAAATEQAAIPVAGTEVILVDDPRRVSLSRTAIAVTEPERTLEETYEVVLGSPPSAAVTVIPAVAGSPEVTVSGALTFAPETWDTAQTVTVTVAPDADAVVDEATVSHAVAGGDYAGFVARRVTVTVTEEDLAIDLAVSPGSVDEEGPATAVTVTATLDPARDPPSGPVTVTVAVGSGTAQAGTDFAAAPSAFALTIPANRRRGTATFTLTPAGDLVDEGVAETVAVTGASTLGPVNGAEVRITDDDRRGVTLSTRSLRVLETDAPVTATYEVALETPPTAPVTVIPTAKGSGDVTVSGALTFDAVSWSAAQAVTVTVAPDADADPDDAVVAHEVAGGDYAGFDAPAVTVAVTEDERRVELTVALSGPLEEDGPPVSALVTASLADATRDVETEVSVALFSGTATPGADYTASPSLFTLTIAAKARSATKTVAIAPKDDSEPEGDETFVVLGLTAAEGLVVVPAGRGAGDDPRRRPARRAVRPRLQPRRAGGPLRGALDGGGERVVDRGGGDGVAGRSSRARRRAGHRGGGVGHRGVGGGLHGRCRRSP